MPFFQYWHIYYDSIFVRIPFKLPFALLQQLQIRIGTLPWPSLSELPQLPRLLQILEKFILNQSNWVSCKCNFLELASTQMRLNTILLGLQCEKYYGAELWKKNKRRIYASIIHFFLFLKNTIAALIPQNCLNIYDAANNTKLSTTLSCLESLMNKIIKKISSIYSYMISQFKEEQKILLQFFIEVNIFIMHLPTASIKQLHSIPKIMEYYCTINPLENNKESQDNKFYLRKKNVTLFEIPKQSKDESVEILRKKHSMNNFVVVNNSIVKSKKSTDNKHNESPAKKIPILFKFNEQVRNHCIKKRVAKKMSLGSAEQQKSSKEEKQLASLHQHLLSASNYPIKSKTLPAAIQSRPKNETASQKRQRWETMNTNISDNQPSHKIPHFIQNQEIEIQREEKMKKKKIAKLPLKTISYSEQLILSTGARKGWGIIKQYINYKIAKRKLKKLLLI